MPAIIAVAVVAAVGSAVMQGIQASQAAAAQKQAAEYNAQVAANQAQVAAQQRTYNAQVAVNNEQTLLEQRSSSLQQGEVDAQASMRQQARMIGEQRAQISANGIDLTQGSAQDLLASTKFLGGIDVNTIQSNAARTAWGYDTQASNVRSKAIIDSYNSTADVNAFTFDSQMSTNKANSINPSAIGAMAAGTSLLSSIGSAASSYASAGGGGGGKIGGTGSKPSPSSGKYGVTNTSFQ